MNISLPSGYRICIPSGMSKALRQRTWVERTARIGMIAKGIVYLTMGILAFMAAFEIAGTRDEEANRKGVFNFIRGNPAGTWLLGFVAAGLVCYGVWRIIQSFTTNDKKQKKKWMKRSRYLFSGLSYLALAFTAIKIMFNDQSNGDKNQQMSAQIMEKPYGGWLLILGALAFAATGMYQAWYGFANKYKKHVQDLDLKSTASSILLPAGKVGYVARGIVWLLLAFLLSRAAIHSNAHEAGDTGKAFEFVEASVFGSYILAALGLGLAAYGIFNFIRARWERF
ncbi:MAG: DUF1206 domain-containing protein [Flavisolibacter sp.]